MAILAILGLVLAAVSKQSTEPISWNRHVVGGGTLLGIGWLVAAAAIGVTWHRPSA